MRSTQITKLLGVLIILTGLAMAFKVVPSTKAWAFDESGGFPAVPYYRQCDSSWGSLAANGVTICSGGSARTSMAMILTYYGSTITPDKVSGTDMASTATANGLKTSTNIGWANIDWLLGNQRPVIISVGSSMFSPNGSKHHIVLKGKVGEVVYINDPAHPNIKFAGLEVVKSAYMAGTQYSMYARPTDYDPCDNWESTNCIDAPGPANTAPVVTLGSSSVEDDNSVTVKAKATDAEGDKVRLQFRIRTNDSNLVGDAKCTAYLQDSYYSATNSAYSELVLSGQEIPYNFKTLSPGTYVWSARAMDSNSNIIGDLKFCYENGINTAPATGWADAKTVIVPVKEISITPPKIELISPKDVTTYSAGTPVNLAAKATTTVSGKSVQLAIKARKTSDINCTDVKSIPGTWTSLVSGSNSYSYDFSGLSAGSWYWTAVARDSDNNRSVSQVDFCGTSGWATIRTFTISSTPTTPTPSTPTVTLPTISLSNPNTGTIYSGGVTSVNLSATAKTTVSGKSVQLAIKVSKDGGKSCFAEMSGTWTPFSTATVSKSYAFSGLSPGTYTWSAVARDSDYNRSGGSSTTTFCGTDGWAAPLRTFTIEQMPVTIVNSEPVITISKETKSGNSVTVYAKATDPNNDKVRIHFRIRRNEANWTVEQKCSTTDSIIDYWSEYAASGTAVQHTFNGLNGNYVWSARAQDNGTPLLKSLGSGERFCYENGTGTAEAYGWVTALPVTVP